MTVNTTPAATGKRSLRLSVASTKQTQQFSALAKGYKALSMADKSTWIALVNKVNASTNRTGRHKLSAANLYTKINTVRLACNLAQLSTAPSDLPPVAQLPNGISLATAANGSFTCNILCPQAYLGYVQITAPPIAPAGYNTYNPRSFRIIGTLGGLAQGTSSAADLYAAKYGAPPPGAEVVLNLIPMDILGERLPGRIITGIVSGPGVSQEGPESDLLRAA